MSWPLGQSVRLVVQWTETFHRKGPPVKTDYERLETRRFRELRKENIRLRKENKQLRKDLRIQEEMDLEASIADEVPYEMIPVDTGKPEVECPKCQARVVTFNLRGLTYYRCPDCSSKGKITA